MKKISSLFIAVLFLLINSLNANAAENSNWKQQYYSVIKEKQSVLNEYAIFDIDNDGIPELICAFYDSEKSMWLLLFYTAENKQIVEIGRLEFENSRSISLTRPAYPNKGYLILSDRGEYANYIGSGTAYYKITKDGLKVNSEKIAVIEEGWRNGRQDVYYPTGTYHPNELEYVYEFGGLTTTKTDFFNRLSLGTQLNFISSYSPLTYEYNWDVLSNTPSLYTFPSNSPEDTPHSSNPVINYDTVYYTYPILENENEFTSEIVYPSGVREFSVHNDSGIIFTMVNGSFINCEAIIENGVEMLPTRIIFEALGKKVQWDSDSRTINVRSKNLNLLLTTGSLYAQLNGEDITLNTPPTAINGQSYIPVSLFYNNPGISVDIVPNLLSATENATIIALENTYPDTDIMPEEDIRKQLITELKKATNTIRDYIEPFEEPSFVSNLGRYYIYNSNYIYGGGVLIVNKYTGEVYTALITHFSGFFIASGIYTR